MSDISYTPTTWVNDVTAINATRMNNIESGVDATDQAITDHLADTTDAHDASAISVADAGTFYTATDVEGVLQEIGPQLGVSGIDVIADTLLGANTNTFDFTSIPGTYTALMLVLYMRGTKAATSTQPRLTFNADTGSNYDVQKWYSAATGTSSSATIGQAYIDLSDASAASSDTGAVSVLQLMIPNYAGTTFHKALTQTGFNPRAYSSGNEYEMNVGGVWKSTAAITRITITPDSNQWATGSRATLYGL